MNLALSGAWCWCGEKMNRWDVLGFVGTLLVSGGFWFVWPPLILFWLGAVVIVVGILGARNGHLE